MLRRTALASVLAVSAAALGWGVSPAWAQEFPARPLRLVVPLSPGGVTDVMARLIATEMSKQLGQSVVVENRTGANGAIGGDLVAKAPPDGYTIGFFPNSMMMILPLLGKFTNASTDLKPVARLYDLDLFIVARSDYPSSTLPELIAAAKAQPGKISYGTTGVGSSLHLAMELIKMQGGFDMTHIPYRGGSDQMNALLGKNLDVAIVGTYDAGVWTKQGKVKPIASLAGKRNSQFPDVPTVAESGFPGFVSNSWAALFVPTGTPQAIADRIGQAAAAALREPVVRERLMSAGLSPRGDERSDQISASMKVESETWSKIVQKLGASNLQ